MAHPGYASMRDETKEPRLPREPHGVHLDGTSLALSAALQKTFESLLQEPVPEKFNELIARIRAEELRKSAESDGNKD